MLILKLIRLSALGLFILLRIKVILEANGCFFATHSVGFAIALPRV